MPHGNQDIFRVKLNANSSWSHLQKFVRLIFKLQDFCCCVAHYITVLDCWQQLSEKTLTRVSAAASRRRGRGPAERACDFPPGLLRPSTTHLILAVCSSGLGSFRLGTFRGRRKSGDPDRNQTGRGRISHRRPIMTEMLACCRLDPPIRTGPRRPKARSHSRQLILPADRAWVCEGRYGQKCSSPSCSQTLTFPKKRGR